MIPDNETDDVLRERGLPAPTPEERAHQARLIARIRDEMGCNALPFSRFMELALYAPGLGYYAAGKRKFGASGDFVTAPELGELFAGCIANQCMELFAQTGARTVMEVGAGSGALAAQLLRRLESLDALPDRYYLLELSTELRDRQRRTLSAAVPHLMDRVAWFDAFPVTPLRGVVLANELLDAMPVEIFRHTDGACHRRFVSWTERGFAWHDMPAGDALAQRVVALGLTGDYTSELGLAAQAWVHGIAAHIETGALLIVDYGFPRREYYHPQRRTGTLMCHYRHRAHDDPLILAGLQDITAHVDFTAIAETARNAGLDVLGYTSQAAFLLGCGLDRLMTARQGGDARGQLALTNEVKHLTLPSEMGELFKVLALGRNIDGPLRGFALQDRRGAL